jgi:uncharacterized repeat protein (TIGR04138 family)
MHETTFEDKLDRILAKDPRYPRDAYVFVREALDYTRKFIANDSRRRIQHVTGQQLLAGIRQFALSQFGPMAPTVFAEWGILTCRDFGDIVFNMIDVSLLAKTDRDTRADFLGGYDFDEAFRKPFLPATKLAAPAPKPKSAKA